MHGLFSKAGLLVTCGALSAACAGPDELEPASTVARRVEEAGPVLARIGGWQLRPAEVDALAAAAVELRSRPPWSLPPPPTDTFDERLSLAVELLSLAAAAQDGGLPPALVKDSRSRALAAAYLRRLVARRDRQPITDEQLRLAHQAEVHTYLTTGESKLYEPTRLDLDIIGVGRFPSWSSYDDDSFVPVLSEEQTGRLAAEIRAACGRKVSDVDGFEQIARRFSSGNPTVRIEHHPLTAIDPSLFPLAPELRPVLDELDGFGAVSRPIQTPGGSFILRRGVLRPGRGEDVASIKAELERLVRRERRQRIVAEDLSRLMDGLIIQTWPERLGTLAAGTEGP